MCTHLCTQLGFGTVTVTFASKFDPVAVYAAIVSTVVLFWQIFVWFRAGPRLKLSASPNMLMSPSDGKTYIVANVRNIGTQQTTITHVLIYAYPNWWARFRENPSLTAIVPHTLPAAYSIPFVIDVGHTFLTMIVQVQELEKRSRDELLFIGIIHSFRDKPLLARVHPIKDRSKKLETTQPR
jgi:hypothetical protein